MLLHAFVGLFEGLELIALGRSILTNRLGLLHQLLELESHHLILLLEFVSYSIDLILMLLYQQL